GGGSDRIVRKPRGEVLERASSPARRRVGPLGGEKLEVVEPNIELARASGRKGDLRDLVRIERRERGSPALLGKRTKIELERLPAVGQHHVATMAIVATLAVGTRAAQALERRCSGRDRDPQRCIPSRTEAQPGVGRRIVEAGLGTTR